MFLPDNVTWFMAHIIDRKPGFENKEGFGKQ